MPKTRTTTTDSKWNVIKYLIKNGLTPKELVDLKKENITKKGIEIDGKVITLSKETLGDFGEYLRSNKNKINETTYIFLGRKPEQWTEQNFLLAFKAYLKIEGTETLEDYGLSIRVNERAETMDDILNLLK